MWPKSKFLVDVLHTFCYGEMVLGGLVFYNFLNKYKKKLVNLDANGQNTVIKSLIDKKFMYLVEACSSYSNFKEFETFMCSKFKSFELVLSTVL